MKISYAIGKNDGREGESQLFTRNGKFYFAVKVGQRWMYARLFETLDNADLLTINDHLSDTDNPHNVIDTQVHDGVGGHITFNDGDTYPHEIYVVNGRLTNWIKDTDEQLS